MKRPKLKKASKRVSCAKRFKIQKKVREHNRKLRKVAKKKGISRKPKKDIGVPNSAPFKEEVLREAEQRKQELETLKEQNKIVKQQERAAKRKKEKEAESAGDGPATKKAKKVVKAKEAKAALIKEKSAKTFKCCELNKVIEESDVIVEVLDARDPLGCRCPQLEETVLKHEGKKKLLFILNKIDLVPKDNVEKWLQYLEAECPTFLFKASMQIQDRTVQQRKQRGITAVLDHSRAASCFGRDCLLQTLTDLANKKDAETMLKVGVVGFPNVGKSSIINSLKEVRVCHVGVQRGMTRCKQEVHITKRLKMIDSPGIVAASSNPGDVMALRSLQVEEKEESPLEAVRTLLKQCNQQHIMLQYNVPDYRNSLEFLTTFAKKRGFLQKGGVPNTELAAMTFLSDWTGPKLSYHSRAPEHQGLPSYLTDAIVTELRSGLDMDVVRKGNENVKKGVRFPNLASSISFNARGPTAGVLNVSELPKETITITAPTEADEKMDGTVNTEEPEAETQVSTVVTQIQESTKKKKAKPTKKVNYVPVNIDLTSVQHNNDDAYDFNTDFV
ncbi:guanine nucleotide-binding protein-like 3 [Sinocyclocheilus rhinocerous]|uniref:Guanine nucleotide-binding protein-like 3 n=1 Tax=Sinocyclocheilus rhinocerous TaxID=307959 RepID=A0A673JXH1_9TELE|nr:PREDICTED: guanine nucleotide-binding protein-like 3 [Sinocyclocheilus rhinocerous]